MSAEKKRKKKIGWIILLVLSLLLISIGIGVAAWVYGKDEYDYSQYIMDVTSTFSPETEPTEPDQTQSRPVYDPDAATEPRSTEPEELPENPIDFEGLQQLNGDIYAWIYIPNTGIDLPIFQAPPTKDDNYYMHRDINGKYDYKGGIYTQRANKKDFSDPVTLIYGHNMLDDTMFSNLDYFMDDRFFADNRYFYIYMPGHVLVYEIVSAYQYDERHILNSFDFSKEEIFQEYIDYILNPRSMVADVRQDVSITTQDRIVTLSTCMNSGTARYLVQGVLIKHERTK